MSELFNAAEYLTERRVAADDGGRIAVRHPRGVLTYEGLVEQVRRVAGGLAGIGVRAEERVVLCMADDVELFTAILATMYLGAVAVPCSTMLTGAELGVLVADSRARVLIGSHQFSEPVHIAAAPTWDESPALWLYTSGTTGKPKGAMHRHADIRFVCETYGSRVLGIRPDDVCLSVAKLFFAYGIGNSMFFPLSVGASTVLEPARPALDQIARHVREHDVTLLFAVPSFWGPMLAGDLPGDALAGVRQGVSAGEALPERMFTGIRDRFGVEILDGIGSTEALHIFISNRAGAAVPNSSGFPVPGYDVELRRVDGTVIEGSGEPGMLWVSGESICTGYWCRTSVNRAVFQGEWMRTGDQYVRNADASLTCLGRADDVLKVGGIWVAPAEVESRLLEHPGLAEAVVVGIPDADGLDKPVAYVVPMPGAVVDTDEVIAFCRAGLASFKRPRSVVVVGELPKTATGKVQRYRLRQGYRSEAAAGVTSGSG
jgi:benzoate-CoA ligase